MKQGHYPLVLGREHSCAIGRWSGFRSTLPEQSSLGLLWVDTHMDSYLCDNALSCDS